MACATCSALAPPVIASTAPVRRKSWPMVRRSSGRTRSRARRGSRRRVCRSNRARRIGCGRCRPRRAARRRAFPDRPTARPCERIERMPPTGLPVLPRSVKNASPAALRANCEARKRPHVAGTQLRIPSHRDDGGEAVIAHAPRALADADHLALGPLEVATRRGAVAHAERRVSVAHAIAERGRNLPQRPPDFQAAVRLAKRHRFLDRLAPCGDILERDGARIAVAEDRFDALPAPPPILARARRLARPLVRAPIAPERLAESARRIHGQFLGSLRGEIVRRAMAGEGASPRRVLSQRSFHCSASAQASGPS